MTTISTLPTAPSRSDPSTFSDRSDALLGALATFVSETNTVAGEVNANAATATTQAALATTNGAAQVSLAAAQVSLAAAQVALATTQATNAANSATSAATSALTAGAVAWVSGTTYSTGNVRYSPIDFQAYRRTTNGAGTTDPSLDSTNWTKALLFGVSAVTTATTATTLTNTATLLKITPASYGVAVTLPDATTCNLGGPLHIIDNKGAYPVRVLNSAGTLLGFVYGGVVSHVSLSDKSTAAGVWTIENNELVGASAQLLVADTFVSFTSSSAVSVELGAGRELLLASATSYISGYLYGVVYDSATNIFGTVTLIRGANIRGNYSLAVVDNNSVLVVSCVNNNTALEAVVLSISGTTITVNTAATATLSANFSSFADGCGLIAVGSSFVTSYTVATPAAQIRALSISGTTVTIGSATVLQGTVGGLIVAASSDKVIAVSAISGTQYFKPYTVSGSSISAGTGATKSGAGTDLYKFGTFSSGRFFVILKQATTSELGGVVLTLSGTTISASTLVTLCGGGLPSVCADAIVVGSNKVLVLSTDTTGNANILTDTAGTASAGTAITLSSQTTRACLYASGTDVAVQEGTTTYLAHMVDCSGASPVLTKTITTGGSSVEAAAFSASNAVLSRSPKAVYGTAYARNVWMSAVTQNFDPEIKGGVFRRREHTNVPGDNTSPGAAYRGKSASEIWIADATTVITKIECVQ